MEYFSFLWSDFKKEAGEYHSADFTSFVWRESESEKLESSKQ